jgi:NADPH-dependent ferric siderophore reductase
MEASPNPFHEAAVVRRRYLTPGMIRLTLGGGGIAGFRSTGIADEYIRLFFPDPETGELVLPEIGADGRWTFPEDRHRVRYSTYTVRRHDAASCELDIDMVVHAGGRASDWACATSEDDRVVINNPRGLYKPPADCRRQILLGDATGLPAIARILENAPPDMESRVVIEVRDAGEQQPLPEHPGADVTWLTGSGNGVGESRLGSLLADMPMGADPGYLWVAAERAAVRALRAQADALGCFADDGRKLVAYWGARS